MVFEIDLDTISKTTKCMRNFECLQENESPLCEVCNCIGKGAYQLTKLERRCNSYVSFGDLKFCTCPVRKEIFDKYQV